ncbi:diadenylate cyclase [Halalkalicoccus tibetensis]|uniref:Diadenylate cyclase n=1 Tax=Halalkalicoccus tibetensis TaxID=175632 RepID=A0ABD5V5Q0_9EURY
MSVYSVSAIVTTSALRIEYETHRRVQEILDRLFYTLESISVEFNQWDDKYAKGPGLYIAVVTGRSIDEFADPMGSNQWPLEQSNDVLGDLDALYETAKEVALTSDGAVVVSVDGVIHEQMVRFRDVSPEQINPETVTASDYEAWMGARHMSALDTSKRENVISTVTLSEETGRVTQFNRGSFLTFNRTELGGDWNSSE